MALVNDSHRTAPSATSATSAPIYPCAEALVGSTLASMTAWVDPSSSCHFSLHEQRMVLSRKVVANLSCLKDHPSLSVALRAVMNEAHQRWLGIAQSAVFANPATAFEIAASADLGTDGITPPHRLWH